MNEMKNGISECVKQKKESVRSMMGTLRLFREKQRVKKNSETLHDLWDKIRKKICKLMMFQREKGIESLLRK